MIIIAYCEIYGKLSADISLIFFKKFRAAFSRILEMQLAGNGDHGDARVETLRSCDEKLGGVKDGQIYLIYMRDALYFESVGRRCLSARRIHTRRRSSSTKSRKA